jgi:SH3-like domain-containing protein
MTVVATAIVLFAGPAGAATAVVLRAGAEVRSAPFAVAPVVAHLELDATLPADDQPTNGWRRVRLPNGTFGFVADDALRVEASPARPAAAPAAAATPTPASTTAAPDVVAARVKVLELTARTQPDTAAPVLRVFPSGALLTVAPSAENGWRRTRLPDGQTAYVAEAGLDFGPAPEATATSAPVQPIAPAPSAQPRAKLYVADLEHLATLVANDSVVSPMVESLVARRQGAIATAIIGGVGGGLIETLAIFTFKSQDCVSEGTLGPPLCSSHPNMPMVWAGIGVIGVAGIIAAVLYPKRSDLFDVVNTWNPRHLDDQLSIESVPASSGSGIF